jgi:hypothetical protein
MSLIPMGVICGTNDHPSSFISLIDVIVELFDALYLTQQEAKLREEAATVLSGRRLAL